MKTSVLWAGALSLALSAGNALADEFGVSGKSAAGRPGERVFVEVVYDYGAGSGFTVEDLQFEYLFDGISFNPTATTIGASGAAPLALMAYVDALTAFAQAHSGSVLMNLNAPGSTASFKGVALSYQVTAGAQFRSGEVHLNLAFDILGAALPGIRPVSFTDMNALVDDQGTEFSYPAAMKQLSVSVVPEPQIAWLLLPGLALVGLCARRRRVRSF